jgi:hypothetical protein
MSEVLVDLIYVEYSDRREMSVAIVGDGKDQLFGPEPSNAAIKALSPKVAAALPGMFSDVAAAENYLTMVHFKNMTMCENSAGQAYPFKVDAKK